MKYFFYALRLQVRTLFVSGLPVDIKPRELYLLFRPFKVSQVVFLEEVMMYFHMFSSTTRLSLCGSFFPGAESESQKVLTSVR